MKKNILLMTSGEPGYGPCFTKEKRFPLGIGFLIAVLRNQGHTVYFIDNYLSRSYEIEEGFLDEKKIDYVGIYSSTICFNDTLRLIKALQLQRDNGWAGQIIVGGPHASLFSETLPSSVDHIVIGEGEITLPKIINGTVKERIVKGEVIVDLDSLPIPAYDAFQDHRYWTRVDPSALDPIYTMNTSRGCPYHCKFCAVKGIWGKTYRAFTAERVVHDIEYLIKKFGIKGVYFREDHFTFDYERTVRFCELLLKKNINITWFCESRVNNLDRDLLSLMKRSGCEWLYLGCESGSQRILDYLRKGITVEQIEQVITDCNKLGIETYASWILGTPAETDRELEMTLDLIHRIKPTINGKNVFVGFPGSELYDEMITTGDYFYKDEFNFLYTHKYNDLVKRFYGKRAETCTVPREPQGVLE